MIRRKPRDMSGTARCGTCGDRAVHEAGPGSPLVIHHLPGCDERTEIEILRRDTRVGDWCIEYDDEGVPIRMRWCP